MVFLSCTKDQGDQINIEQLLGNWRLTETTINGLNKTELVDRSVWMGFENENAFFRNYIIGTWSLQKNTIVLSQREDSGNFYLEFEILQLSNNAFKVKTSLTEREYNWDFDEFESDEILVVIETYEKL